MSLIDNTGLTQKLVFLESHYYLSNCHVYSFLHEDINSVEIIKMIFKLIFAMHLFNLNYR